MSQSVEQSAWAQVMISWFVSSAPVGLCADSSEPEAWFGFPLSLLLPCSHSVSVFLSLKNKHLKNNTGEKDANEKLNGNGGHRVWDVARKSVKVF